MRKATLALVTMLVLSLAPAPVAVSAPPVPLPGAPGIGDPYFPTDGNGGYQVDHYDLRIGYTPATDVLTGVATLRATATQSLSRFNLDLDGLTVDAIRVNGAAARWTRHADELRIRPQQPLRTNRAFVVKIRYHGVPKFYDEGELGKNGVIPTTDGAIAVGQPHVADNWFPANDHPLDKATYRIEITAPRALQAVSNGQLRSLTSSQGLRTWTWRMNRPMASYLAIVAIGRFNISTSRTAGVTYISAIDPTLYEMPSIEDDPASPTIGERAEAALGAQPEVVAFLSGVLGPYPFRESGGIVDNDPEIGYALENQTRPIYDKRFFVGGDPTTDDSVVVHELAHQWFGDSVALARWRDIWLNDGPASYMEWLWSEEQGLGTADEIFASFSSIPSDDPFWQVRIGDPGPANIFDIAVYYRGAMTLHALRNRIGDETFFRLLERWSSKYAQGNATTRQFIDLAERMSGQNLDPFFRTWLYTAGKPAGLDAVARTSAGSSDVVKQMIARKQPGGPRR
jgi:aminopeptidase N